MPHLGILWIRSRDKFTLYPPLSGSLSNAEGQKGSAQRILPSLMTLSLLLRHCRSSREKDAFTVGHSIILLHKEILCLKDAAMGHLTLP